MKIAERGMNNSDEGLKRRFWEYDSVSVSRKRYPLGQQCVKDSRFLFALLNSMTWH